MSRLHLGTILKDSENFRDLVREPTRLDRSVPGVCQNCTCTLNQVFGTWLTWENLIGPF